MTPLYSNENIADKYLVDVEATVAALRKNKRPYILEGSFFMPNPNYIHDLSTMKYT